MTSGLWCWVLVLPAVAAAAAAAAAAVVTPTLLLLALVLQPLLCPQRQRLLDPLSIPLRGRGWGQVMVRRRLLLCAVPAVVGVVAACWLGVARTRRRRLAGARHRRRGRGRGRGLVYCRLQRCPALPLLPLFLFNGGQMPLVTLAVVLEAVALAVVVTAAAAGLGLGLVE